MKHISIDPELCQGAGECAAISPDGVTFDEEGISSPTGIDLPDEIAERMVAACPSMAITATDAHPEPADSN